jgi:hypothetical protein
MARRADPERINQARRAAIRNALTSEGMPQELAETWCHSWEVRAAELGLDRLTSDYWTLGLAWIQRSAVPTRVDRGVEPPCWAAGNLRDRSGGTSQLPGGPLGKRTLAPTR